MAFSELGKLLEVVESVVGVMEIRLGLPDNIVISSIEEIRKKIFELKQREGFK